MEGVTVTDNHSTTENIKVEVTSAENTDGTYLATYTAIDEAGNQAIEYATITH
jgi:hypothetical protein